MKVLCFGSLNIDYTYQVDHFVQKGETILSKDLQVFPGGKGFNQSIALARAGLKTYMAGKIGTDGLFLKKLLEENNVNTDFIKVSAVEKTGNAIIQNDKDGDNCILLYGGTNQTITREHMDSVLSAFEKGDVLILQNEINDMGYLMEKAHEKGLKIVLNPSPMDEKIEQYPLDLVDIFLLNEVEGAQLLKKKDISFEEMISELWDKYNTTTILTVGEKGAYYKDQQMFFHQEAYVVKAVDTTAAGDTFTGYFLKEYFSGNIRNALQIASLASSIAVTRKGAYPSIPTMEEVKERL
ncbi:MAG: ribokinase [Bacillota bacterium]|nr:ribokinase [Bacillota bacterium]